jgi:ATP-dependent DNA helicase RecQ
LALEENLRALRKAEAAKTGKPAFIVFSDAALQALVLARPQTIGELLTVSGFGPDKTEKYGAAIVALCRQTATHSAIGSNCASDAQGERTVFPGSHDAGVDTAPAAKSRRSPARPVSAQREPVPETFTNEAPSSHLSSASAADLSFEELEARLRAWRKEESEKMGLPQFFVLGTSALRSIVMARPRTLSQLQRIEGIGAEKLSRFGDSILQVCNQQTT